MQTLIRSRKWLVPVLALLALAGFALALVHTHAGDDDHGHDCPVCRFVQDAVCFLVLVFSALVLIASKPQRFFTSEPRFTPVFLSPAFANRAPPFTF